MVTSNQKDLGLFCFKTINNNIHAVIVDIDDENTEMLVAFPF